MSNLLALPSKDEVDRVARTLGERHFPEVAAGIRRGIPAMLATWRTFGQAAIPELDRLTHAEFENSVGTLLGALAGAMECHDPQRIRRIIEDSPLHGAARFVQKLGPQTLLAEERILRSVIVIELRAQLGRAMSDAEAAALHELLDLIGEYSLLTLIGQRGEEQERLTDVRMSGMHRLAGLGTLVAGVAHDATNLFLPLRMTLEHLERSDLPPEAREALATVRLIIGQFQNSIVNLRWLSVDTGQAESVGGHAPRPPASLGLHAWAAEALEFHLRTLPRGVGMCFDLPEDLPRVAVGSAALSQAVFNLIRNAHQAIVGDRGPGGAGMVGGQVRVWARLGQGSAADARVELTIQDDGPGMTPETLRRIGQVYFTTKEGGSGLGLALVRALVAGWGGSLAFHSPPPGEVRGTAVVLTLPVAGGG